ncbi:MAG: hypothetical protein IPM92_12585 [Saprospiraceae bacterium]|nr:hypothetical protein [Saprospiraceae bacterium]
MKRRRILTDLSLSYSIPWTIMVVVATICFLSCACKSKGNTPEPAAATSAPAAPPTPAANNSFVPQAELESTYKQLVAAVKAQPGFEFYGEFLDNGKYLNSFMRMDILKFIVLIPSDASLKSLGEVEFSKLIYPELVTQDHLNFFQKHTAFGAVAEGPNPTYRTFHNRMINLDNSNKQLISGNFKTRIVHEEKVNPAIQLLFVENLIN